MEAATATFIFRYEMLIAFGPSAVTEVGTKCPI